MEEFLFTVSHDTYGNDQRSPADIAQEQLWNELSSLYSDNGDLKKEAAKLDPTSTSRDPNVDSESTAEKLDHLLDAFMTGANAVLEELTFLGNAHPALALAIFAFHEVVKLDIARRDNNKKVLVVVLQMQSMLGPMFQLRNLDHTHMPETERQFHEGRLKEMIDVITRNIKVCRSDITHFMNRKFVCKLVLSKGYEKKFASHIEAFALRRSELQSVISEYVAVGISSANIAIGEVGKKIDSVDTKIDKIISVLFRNLDTPRERDVFKFMQQNGGPEKCVNDLDLLPKLILKAGESPTTGKVTVSDQAELKELQKALSEALKEDLDKVLEKHYSRFEKVLQVQSNNLKQITAHLEDQGVLMQTHTTKLGKILDTVTTIMVLEEGKFRTKSVKLKDPEIQRVWNQMNLTTSSVKAKVFVLTFRDHIRVENSGFNTPVQGTVPLPGQSDTLFPASPTANATADDSEWVLEYIDVAYVQPIVEAMDEDGSGFISVKEANSFALARPKDLSLLHWIAYWAAGWHINLVRYQMDIYSILAQMRAIVPEIHIANRTCVDDFLDQPVMGRIEALLRSIKGLPYVSKNDPKLLEVAHSMASWQLERLKTNLSDMGFVIESSFVATAISGSARVETWIMPLLYLLLQRHLEVVKIARTIVLDRTELEAHVTSLMSIFAVFDERMENLEAKFQQLHRDVDAQFSSFSYGMFYAAFKRTEFDASINNPLALRSDEYSIEKALHLAPGSIPDVSILAKPPGMPFSVEDIDIFPSEPPPSGHNPHPIEGLWLGWFIENNRRLRPNRCFIRPIVNNMIVAKSESFFGSIDIVGRVSAHPDPSTIPVELQFVPKNPDFRPFICQGIYDPVKDVIAGTFMWKLDDDDPTANVNDIETAASEAPADRREVNANEAIIDPVSASASANGNDNVSAGLESPSPSLEPITQIAVETSPIEVLPDELEIPSSDSNIEDPAIAENVAPPDTDVRLFYMTRTPPYLFRFRYILDGPGPAPCWNVWPIARKRWAFATEAVLYEVRITMNSKEVFEEALAERRRWIYHGIRYDMTEPTVTPAWKEFDELTNEEWDAYDALFGKIHPSIGRVYEETGHYMARREMYIVGRVFCDSCRKLIAFRRHQCIICVQDDLNDGIDLCVNCFAKPDTIRAGNMLHSISHPLLRSKHRVHNLEKGIILPEARLIAERSKKLFRDIEEAKQEQKERSGKSAKGKGSKKSRMEQCDITNKLMPIPETIPILCACCEKVVTLPCWVCVACLPLTFICDICDRRNAPAIDIYRGHSPRDHHLLRIHDTIEVKPSRLKKGTEVEQQLEELNISISTLEEKVNMQIEEAKEIKTVIEDVAKSVGLNDYDFAPSESLINDFEEAIAVGGTAPDADPLPDDKGATDNPLSDEQEDDSRRENPNELPKSALKSQLDLRERLNALEAKVELMNQTLMVLAQDDRNAAIESKVDALETKIDQQFGRLLSLVQNLISSSRPLPNGSSS